MKAIDDAAKEIVRQVTSIMGKRSAEKRGKDWDYSAMGKKSAEKRREKKKAQEEVSVR